MKNIIAVLCLSVSPVLAFADCPATTGVNWAQGSTHTYSLGNLSDTEKTQVRQGFDEWNTANAHNGSNVTFTEATGSQTPDWTWNNGTTPDGSTAGARTTINSSSSVDSASTTIGINNNGADGKPIYNPTSLVGYSTIFKKVAMHEIGHSMGLKDVTGGAQSSGQTVMNQISGPDDQGRNIPDSIGTEAPNHGSLCDDLQVASQYPPPSGGGGGGGGGGGKCGNEGNIDPLLSTGDGCDPILIDTEGEGFHMTSFADGVTFDIRGDGRPIQLSWTSAGFHNAFLALPEGDGMVHSGKDLFSNFAAQDKTRHANGFLALAEWDELDQGGNGDGIIDENDAVFSRLRLWIDSNHDGISQPEELHTLPELGVYSLSLAYGESRRTDEFGNQFRYKARVNQGIKRDRRDEASEVGRTAYDVFFVTN